MKIHEYQAKDILARYGIPIQPGKVATTPQEAEQIAREFGVPVVIKADGEGRGHGASFGGGATGDPGWITNGAACHR